MAAMAVSLSSCQKTPKGILEGTVYMTKNGGSGRVQVNKNTGERRALDLKVSFKSDKECIIKYVLPDGKDYSRYDGTYIVSEPSVDGSREINIETNIPKFGITGLMGELSEDLSIITADYVGVMGVVQLYKQ